MRCLHNEEASGENTMDPSTMYDLVGMIAGGLMWSGGLPALVMTAVIVFVGIARGESL